MDTFKSYTQRVATTTPTMFGFRLAPFSFGHSLLLKAAKSKFINHEYDYFCDINNIVDAIVTDNENILGEFAFALMVCSNDDYDDFKNEVSTGAVYKLIGDFRDRISQSKDVIKEIHTFAHYLKNGTDAPKFAPKEQEKSSGECSAIDGDESIISTLMQECGYTRNECLNLPLTETLSAYLVYAHRNGSIQIINKEWHDMTEAMKGVKA